MKKIIILLFLSGIFTTGQSTSISTSPATKGNPVTANDVFIPLGNSGEMISLMELSQINAKEFEKLSGKKMKFVDKVNFKLGQRELRKSINKDGSFNNKKIEKYLDKAGFKGSISIGGLLLGLFLSLIGVLIAYLISSGDKKSRITWAWIGAAISFIIWGAVII